MPWSPLFMKELIRCVTLDHRRLCESQAAALHDTGYSPSSKPASEMGSGSAWLLGETLGPDHNPIRGATLRASCFPGPKLFALSR